MNAGNRIKATFRPTPLTLVIASFLAVCFGIFSFAEPSRSTRFLGEAVYLVFLPSTWLVGLVLRVSLEPLGLLLLPVVVAVESCFLAVLATGAVRAIKSLFRRQRDKGQDKPPQ